MVTFDRELYIILGQRLQKLRNKKGFSLEYVGEKINKTKKTISRYENGEHRMEIDTIKQLCDLYGYSYEKLISEVQQEISNKNDNHQFNSVEEAIKFILAQPLVANFGGYDLDKMTDEEILEFAEDVSKMIEMLGKKYSKWSRCHYGVSQN